MYCGVDEGGLMALVKMVRPAVAVPSFFGTSPSTSGVMIDTARHEGILVKNARANHPSTSSPKQKYDH